MLCPSLKGHYATPLGVFVNPHNTQDEGKILVRQGKPARGAEGAGDQIHLRTQAPPGVRAGNGVWEFHTHPSFRMGRERGGEDPRFLPPTPL